MVTLAERILVSSGKKISDFKIMIDIRNISKSFQRNPLNLFNKSEEKQIVLEDISFKVDKGDCIALLGRNGSGKTTLLKTISGLLQPDKGSVFIKNGINQKISIVNTNDRSFFFRLSVYENLRFFSSFNADFDKKLLEVLGFLDLLHRKDSLYMTLSSGEKKKVSFARAILRDAKVLLFDEITSNLDIFAKKEILDFIRNLVDEKKIDAVIFSTHSLDEVIGLANKIIMLENSLLVRQVEVNEELSLEAIRELF